MAKPIVHPSTIANRPVPGRDGTMRVIRCHLSLAKSTDVAPRRAVRKLNRFAIWTHHHRNGIELVSFWCCPHVAPVAINGIIGGYSFPTEFPTFISGIILLCCAFVSYLVLGTLECESFAGAKDDSIKFPDNHHGAPFSVGIAAGHRIRDGCICPSSFSAFPLDNM